MLSIISLLFLIFSLRNAQIVINGNFKYCDLSHTLTQLNLFESCASFTEERPIKENVFTEQLGKKYGDKISEQLGKNYGEKDLKKDFNKYRTATIFVINKLRHVVHGDAYECKKEKEYVESWKNIWGDKKQRKEKNIIELTAESCEYMVRAKICVTENGEIPMKCDDHSCYHYDKENPDWSYWTTDKQTYFSCTWRTRPLIADNKESKLFGMDCFASRGYCKLHESIIIWSPNDVIDECPYEVIHKGSMNISQNTVIDRDDHLLFQVNGIENVICKNAIDKQNHIESKISLYSTNEGLYLSDEVHHWLSKSIVQSDDLQASREMLLADKDFYDRQIYQSINDVSNQLCIVIMSIMQSFGKFDDTFFRVPDFRGNDAIVYAQHGTIYIPNCINITSFALYTNITTCLDDIPVYFYENLVQRQAYLTREGILRSTSRVVHCRDTDRIIQLKGVDSVVVRKRMKVSILSKNELLVKKIDFSNQNCDSINFIHAKTVFATPDVLMQLQEYSTIQDSNTPIFISGSSKVKKDFTDEIVDKINEWYDEYKSAIVAFVTFVMLLLLAISVLILITCNNCCIFRKIKQCISPKRIIELPMK